MTEDLSQLQKCVLSLVPYARGTWATCKLIASDMGCGGGGLALRRLEARGYVRSWSAFGTVRYKLTKSGQALAMRLWPEGVDVPDIPFTPTDEGRP